MTQSMPCGERPSGDPQWPAILPALLVLIIVHFSVVACAQISDPLPHGTGSHLDANRYVGNEACARCHASIYETYKRTPMAHASGPASEGLAPADFVHQKSGVHYRIYTDAGSAWLSFERPGDPAIQGKRELSYFIGSGRRGRTYLFSVDGFLFESPVNWYAARHEWNMAPSYGESREIPLNLPAYTTCLRCHASGMQPTLNGSENRYPVPPFTQDGVGCERCHGPGEAHLKGGEILNPVKLSADRRDSVCMQCHLEGSVAVERAGRHATDFRPGELLDDYVRHFELTSATSSGVGANSQFEALSESACKKKSGDAMSCMSCHDPHTYPSETERISYYRGKCLACHGAAFGVKHHADSPDCTACHMPSTQSVDIAHTEVTDHHIRRRPEVSPQRLQQSVVQASSPTLAPFPCSKDAGKDIRDQALAWQSLAADGVPEAASHAAQLLPSAAKQSPDDPAVFSGLAFLELQRGADNRASELYQKVLALDPQSIDAASNLAVIEARSGHIEKAISLWQGAFERAPAKSSIGLNLARAFCETGQIKQARLYVSRVLQFNPDLSKARRLQQQLESERPSCGS